MPNGWTDKEVMERIILPKLENVEERVSILEQQLREGTPWGKEALAKTQLDTGQRIMELHDEVKSLKTAALTRDGVINLFNDLFQETRTRGWTPKEQAIKIITVGAVVISLILTAVSVVYR